MDGKKSFPMKCVLSFWPLPWVLKKYPNANSLLWQCKLVIPEYVVYKKRRNVYSLILDVKEPRTVIGSSLKICYFCNPPFGPSKTYEAPLICFVQYSSHMWLFKFKLSKNCTKLKIQLLNHLCPISNTQYPCVAGGHCVRRCRHWTFSSLRNVVLDIAALSGEGKKRNMYWEVTMW